MLWEQPLLKLQAWGQWVFGGVLICLLGLDIWIYATTNTHNQNGQVHNVAYGWMAGEGVKLVHRGPSLHAGRL